MGAGLYEASGASFFAPSYERYGESAAGLVNFVTGAPLEAIGGAVRDYASRVALLNSADPLSPGMIAAEPFGEMLAPGLALGVGARAGRIFGALDEVSSSALLRQRVLANLAESQAARNASNFGKLSSVEWPPFPGTVNQLEVDISLSPGALVDRFGSPYGRYLGPAGTSYSARSLPPGTLLNDEYSLYQVLRPFTVRAGTTAPAFGYEGLGQQFRLQSLDNISRSPATLMEGPNPYLREIYRGSY